MNVGLRVSYAPVLTLSALALACGGNGMEPPAVATVEVAPQGVSFAALGETKQFTAVARTAGGTSISGKSFTWTSSAPGTASVTPSTGIVTAVGNGVATITATADGIAGSANATVAQVATQLRVAAPPGNIAAGVPISLSVTAEDVRGNRVSGSTIGITLGLQPNGQGATLTGTLLVAAIDGIATFADVAVNRAGQQFVLSAAAGPASGTSAPFDVRLRLSSVSVGNGMGCGLAPTGDAYCWGRNQTGGLGNGTSGTDRARPVLVAGNLSFSQVDAGSGSNTNGIHDGGACGVVGSGAAYCWGRNDLGQLGNGNGGVDSKIPVPVSGQIQFQSVGMGVNHACGLASWGDIYCWGDNSAGQLGNHNLGVNSSVPVLVSGGHSFTALFVGDFSTCGRVVAGDLYCWGFAAPTDLSGSPIADSATLLGGGLVFSQADPGTFLHMCGVASAQGYCWGQDYLGGGALGTGTPGDDSIPTSVTGVYTWTYIGAGGSFSCGLRVDGVPMCWGYDYNGEVGQGTPGTGAQVPTVVVGGLTFTNMAVGHGSTCAVTQNDDAYCWGSGLWGERGDGTFAPQAAGPVKVVTP